MVSVRVMVDDILRQMIQLLLILIGQLASVYRELLMLEGGKLSGCLIPFTIGHSRYTD